MINNIFRLHYLYKDIIMRTINRIFCGLLSAKNDDFNDLVM